MTKIIDYNRQRGTCQIVGQILGENKAMLQMVEELGFTMRHLPGKMSTTFR